MTTFVIDVDGVLYEWERTARYLLRELRGNTGLTEESTHWDYIQSRVPAQDWKWLWNEGVRLGLFRHGHVATGAIIGVRALKKAGHKLVVCTHRPERAVRDTFAWFDFHFGAERPYPFSGIHILSDGRPKTEMEGDILIDDKPANIDAWVDSGRDAILFDRPWNQDESDRLRELDWSSIKERYA